ncbi:unnamed protein product [Angiostrongylus costaricensis]|uniref:MFS_1_like domain-containing protein n=1 Tax=Angiostrongylus costaricensis TaxID=334426 RepID=A0A0R3Q2J0_ANGCS|nr:unnamed protein product [Angiostrongylus costaricensis]
MQKEASLFFSILLAASQIGPLFTMILGGEMCSSPLGWEVCHILTLATCNKTMFFSPPAIKFASTDPMRSQQIHRSLSSPKATYYTLGFLTLVTTLAYSFIYSDNVEKNSDLSIWTNFMLFVGYYVGMITYQQYSPTFIKQVLNYSIRETGYFSAIPMVFAIIIKVAIGKLIDHGLCFGPKWRLAGPLVFLEFFSALSIFLTGFIDDRRVALFFNMLFASLHFFVPVICSRTIQIIGAQHAHFALNFNMFIAGFVQILLPGGVQLMVPENTKEQGYLFVQAVYKEKRVSPATMLCGKKVLLVVYFILLHHWYNNFYYNPVCCLRQSRSCTLDGTQSESDVFRAGTVCGVFSNIVQVSFLKVTLWFQ